MNFKDFNLFSKSALMVAALSVASLTSCTKSNQSESKSSNNVSTETSIKDRYIVTLNSVDSSQKDLTSKLNNILSKDKINIQLSEDQVFSGVTPGFVVELNSDQLSKIKSDPNVSSIEKDQVLTYGSSNSSKSYRTSTVSDATLNGQTTPWGLQQIGGSGSVTGKTAWIIDTGIDFNQPDLNVDQSRSKSFLSSTDGGLYYSPTDEFGHGTEVAGIIGAKDNNFGSKGVVPGVSVVSLKVLNRTCSGTLGALVRAINWVATYGKAGDVMNISMGGNASTTVDNAVKAVAAKGIYVSIASGNGYKDCSTLSPQRVIATNVYVVSAIDNTGKFASYSNYGNPVKYAAPGTSIYTTQMNGKYGYVSGTSFAAPYMAGVLLTNNGKPSYSGYATSDPDSHPDPIVHR